MINISVIGGSGFIGTRLVGRMLAKGDYQVTIIDKAKSLRYPQATVIADIRSLPQLSQALEAGSVVVHLAAEHRDDVRPRELYDEVNVQGTRNLVTVAEEKGISTIIFTSSVAVYGFAPVGAGEDAAINPFNDYGRTKFLAEEVLRAWQARAPKERTLCIIRPTVVFGERNRGNVFNLFRQVASGRFVMVGSGKNRKSVAYVENVAAFIEHCLSHQPGSYLYNYVDKPDFDMNEFVGLINKAMGRERGLNIRLPYSMGIALGTAADVFSRLTGRSLALSRVRVHKFCANSVYVSAVDGTNFVRPIALSDAIWKTISYEFLESHESTDVFYSE